ncbi:cation diffusion facilitator family transporter [Deltaproteobacteria bacterium OttesenSCG-928-K17]|nr:cation diffusion facilitator family transporter [Deltaproteobacteria bacterium OttesenSCG-928-K17]
MSLEQQKMNTTDDIDHGAGGREKKAAAMVSIISNTTLVILKLGAGILTGSVAIISEAVHSAMDLAAALMAYVSVRVAERPPDLRHPFGHGKAEDLAALFEGLLIIAAGGFVGWKAVNGLFKPEPLPELGLGMMVMLVSGLVNILVSRFLFKVGRRTESAALIADAWHLRTDVYTSLGVFAALAGIMAGARFCPDVNLTILDPICALVVGLMIIKAGVTLTKEAVNQLLDCSLSRDELGLILSHIQARAPEIKGYGPVLSRRSGSRRLVYMVLHVDGDMPLKEAHALGEDLSDDIREHFPGDSEITFHLEPQSNERKK